MICSNSIWKGLYVDRWCTGIVLKIFVMVFHSTNLNRSSIEFHHPNRLWGPLVETNTSAWRVLLTWWLQWWTCMSVGERKVVLPCWLFILLQRGQWRSLGIVQLPIVGLATFGMVHKVFSIPFKMDIQAHTHSHQTHYHAPSYPSKVWLVTCILTWYGLRCADVKEYSFVLHQKESREE